MPRGNIAQRSAVSAAIKAENKAIANRPANWTQEKRSEPTDEATPKH